MDKTLFKSFIDSNNDLLNSLKSKRVFLVTPLNKGGLLNSEALLEINSSFFNDEDLNVLKTILESDFLTSITSPVVFDMVKAVSLYSQIEGDDNNKAIESLNLSRFSFMGTDGMRGKISTDNNLDPVKTFLNDNILTPRIIELTSYAFGKMLNSLGLAKTGDCTCVGNDGRDVTTNWALNDAMISGFNKSGLDVVDIKVAPTPFVPYQILKDGYVGGAALTASHNPANQNGIKFFCGGKKVLPEGKLGDYSFAAWVYDAYLNGMEDTYNASNKELDIEMDATVFMNKVVPAELKANLKNSFIVLDTANGAFHDLSLKMMDDYGLDYICVNETPTGDNINKACGVAEVEGQEEFEATDYDGALTVIKTVFDKGRELNKTVYGIVLDGDGDRGFILTYDKKDDKVLVIDGDKSGYIMAMYYNHLGMDLSKLNFVTTVESDIMTAFSANEKLGLSTPIVSVGDKWIGSFDEGELLLGLESSGHLIFPIKFESNSGDKVELRAGNGLLTALMTLAGITTLSLDSKTAFEPYEPGFSKTFYTYFVDKTLFYRGSSVWNSDKEILLKEFAKLKDSKKLSAETTLEFQDKEDSHMLYASIIECEKQLGAIFCRNSGTEDKTAVYVKCKEDLGEILLPIGTILRDNHVNNMKNPQRKEYQQEVIILKALDQDSELEINKLKEVVDKEFTEPVSETDLYGVVYGLKKEGRILLENSLVKAI